MPISHQPLPAPIVGRLPQQVPCRPRRGPPESSAHPQPDKRLPPMWALGQFTMFWPRSDHVLTMFPVGRLDPKAKETIQISCTFRCVKKQISNLPPAFYSYGGCIETSPPFEIRETNPFGLGCEPHPNLCTSLHLQTISIESTSHHKGWQQLLRMCSGAPDVMQKSRSLAMPHCNPRSHRWSGKA